jgi:hypothetical protein
MQGEDDVQLLVTAVQPSMFLSCPCCTQNYNILMPRYSNEKNGKIMAQCEADHSPPSSA